MNETESLDRVGARPRVSRVAAGVMVSLLMLSSNGCSLQQKPGAVEVTSQLAGGVRLSEYRTYDWATPGTRATDPSRLSELERRDWLIRNGVDEELRARGMVARSNQPGLLVEYTTTFQFKNTESFQQYAEYRRMGGKESLGKANVYGYEEATLSVVLVDRESGAPIWRGTARGVAYEAADPPARVREAIRQIFKAMPDTR